MNGDHLMAKLLAALAFAIVPASAAVAGEQTITLAVQNMYCAACPYTVKASLEAVPGVGKVAVSYKDKTAVVTYDDTRADLAALVAATTNAGHPSSAKN
jgi:mercuric ion binding protein